MSIKRSKRKNKPNKLALLEGVGIILLVALAFYLVRFVFDFSSIEDISYIRSVVENFGVAGPLVFIVVMALAIIISPIPSIPLDAAAGIIWGPYLATLYAVIGAQIGAMISFVIARKIGRPGVEKMLGHRIHFCDNCEDSKLGWIVFISRLFPFFHFDVVSYGAGLTNMKLRTFSIATFFGMIPATFVFAYYGQSLIIGNTFSIILGAALVVAMFIVPYLINYFRKGDTHEV